MKKFLLSISVFFASGAYMVYQNVGGSAPSTVTQTPVTQTITQGATDTGSPTPALPPSSTPTPTPPAPTPTPTPTPAPKPKGQYADGTYTGSAANAYYGLVQVQVLVQNGKISDVTFLQYPSDRSTSRYINGQAMPLLKNEAIQAQSANVSGVSGATDTSQAFIESLGSALTQAKNS